MYFAPYVIYSHVPGLWLDEVSLYGGALGIRTLVSGDEPASCLWTYSQCCHHCSLCLPMKAPYFIFNLQIFYDISVTQSPPRGGCHKGDLELGGFEPPSCSCYYRNFLYPQLIQIFSFTNILSDDFYLRQPVNTIGLSAGRSSFRLLYFIL